MATAAPAVPSLPAAFYADPDRLALEQRAIFRRTWQVVALAREVTEPGTYATSEVGGVPVVVTRDGDGELHAFVNVCPHRGMVLASGAGRAKLLQCPNHAWTFGLDGRLRKAPRSELEAAWSCEGLDLRRAAAVAWGPLVLVNLDPAAAPPRAELAHMSASVERYGLALEALELRGEPVDWTIAANWKVVCENYLECYHCATVHPSFARVFDVRGDRYALDPRGEVLSATAHVRETRDRSVQQAILSTDGCVVDSHWHLLFPATTVNVYPGAGAVEFTWYWPVDAQTTGGRTVIAFAPGASEQYARQVRELSVAVGDEDVGVCEGLQRGLACGALERPHLMPFNERLLLEFQALVRRYAGD